MKKQLISIAKSITVFILLIFCAVVIDARAEDYLWEPTLAWEDPSPGIGHKLLNNDEWLIYYADNKVQLRELATGKKLAESEDLLQLLNDKSCREVSFSMSNDGKLIYGLFQFFNSRQIIILETQDLKIIKKIKINNTGRGTHYSLSDGSKFFILGPLSCYYVSSDDFRIILETEYDYVDHWPNPGDPVKPYGTCIISFNPNTTEELILANKDSYKMLFYNETQFLNDCEWVFINKEQYHCIDPVSLKIVHSDELPFTVSPRMKYILQERKDKIEILDYKTKEVVNTYSFEELSVDTFMVSAPFKVPLRLLRDDNPERVFPFAYRLEKVSKMGYMSNFYYSGKKRKLRKVVPSSFGDIDVSPYAPITDKDNRYLLITYPIIKIYAIEPKSNVNTDEEQNVIKTDSINAYISIPDGKYPAYMSIYTSDGKLVEEVKEIKIDRDYIKHNIELLPAGLYLLRLSYEDGSTVMYKIVK